MKTYDPKKISITLGGRPLYPPCALCKKPAEGLAWAHNADGSEARLCHGDAVITCYERWTVYGVRP